MIKLLVSLLFTGFVFICFGQIEECSKTKYSNKYVSFCNEDTVMLYNYDWIIVGSTTKKTSNIRLEKLDALKDTVSIVFSKTSIVWKYENHKQKQITVEEGYDDENCGSFGLFVKSELDPNGYELNSYDPLLVNSEIALIDVVNCKRFRKKRGCIFKPYKTLILKRTQKP